MTEKKYELNDDLLEQVSGGTGVDEDEEELPGYDDGNDALAALTRATSRYFIAPETANAAVNSNVTLMENGSV